MIRLAHGRKLVIQEAGYPSAARLGSSSAAQATFVRDVFRAWNRHPRAIPFLSFFALFDQRGRPCSPSAKTDAAAFFCTLGLHRSDGSDKPAWDAFRAGVRSVR